ncbi:hypothetical protein H0H93_016635, partial [Arthromyces matolae]
MTAPDFQPFEKKHAKKKKIGKAQFLLNEEGHDEFNDFDMDAANPDSDEDEDEDRASKSGPIYIDEVLQRANDARTRELPGSYPFVVQQTFINAIITKWHEPTKLLCRAVYYILGEHVRKLVQFHLGPFGQGQLAQRVNRCMTQAEERINWLLKLESRPFSLNTHYLTDYKDKFLAHYRSAREKD